METRKQNRNQENNRRWALNRPALVSMVLPKHPYSDHVAAGCKAIGYWCDAPKQQDPIDERNRSNAFVGNRHQRNVETLPDPRNFVDMEWDVNEREQVIKHVGSRPKGVRIAASWMGSSQCRFCGRINGSVCLTDGTYVWPEGLGHYLQDHGVRPDKEFVEHVKVFLRKLVERT